MEIRFNLTEESLIKVLNFAAGERDDEKVLNYAQELTELTETNEKGNNDERLYEVVKTDSLLARVFGGFSNKKRKELIERAKEYIKKYDETYITKVNRNNRTVKVMARHAPALPSKKYAYPVFDHVWNKHIMKAWGIATYRGSTKDQSLFGSDAAQPHDVVKGMEALVIRDKVDGEKEEYKKGQVRKILKQETDERYAGIAFEKNKKLVNIHELAVGEWFRFIKRDAFYPYNIKIKILSDTKAEYGGDES